MEEGSGGGDDDDDDEGRRRIQTQRPVVQRREKPRRKNKNKKNKIDAAKLANLKKDFPGLAEAIGGLFFQGKSRVGNGMKMVAREAVPRGKSRMTRF